MSRRKPQPTMPVLSIEVVRVEVKATAYIRNEAGKVVASQDVTGAYMQTSFEKTLQAVADDAKAALERELAKAKHASD